MPAPVIKLLVWTLELLLTKVSNIMATQANFDAKLTRLTAAVAALIAKANNAGISGTAEDAFLVNLDKVSADAEAAVSASPSPTPVP